MPHWPGKFRDGAQLLLQDQVLFSILFLYGSGGGVKDKKAANVEVNTLYPRPLLQSEQRKCATHDRASVELSTAVRPSSAHGVVAVSEWAGRGSLVDPVGKKLEDLVAGRI